MKKPIKILIAISITLVIAIISFLFRDKIMAVPTFLNNKEQIKLIFQSWGILGMLLFFILQVLQVIIFFLPGELIETTNGFLYGIFGGFAINISGSIIGSAIAFSITRKLSKTIFKKFFRNEKYKKLSKYLDSNRVNTCIFLIYLIPAIPKDMMVYVCGGTDKVKLKDFLIYSAIGRLPGLFSTTFIGTQIDNGNITNIIITFVICATISIFFLFIKEKIIKPIME